MQSSVLLLLKKKLFRNGHGWCATAHAGTAARAARPSNRVHEDVLRRRRGRRAPRRARRARLRHTHSILAPRQHSMTLSTSTASAERGDGPASLASPTDASWRRARDDIVLRNIHPITWAMCWCRDGHGCEDAANIVRELADGRARGPRAHLPTAIAVPPELRPHHPPTPARSFKPRGPGPGGPH